MLIEGSCRIRRVLLSLLVGLCSCNRGTRLGCLLGLLILIWQEAEENRFWLVLALRLRDLGFFRVFHRGLRRCFRGSIPFKYYPVIIIQSPSRGTCGICS